MPQKVTNTMKSFTNHLADVITTNEACDALVQGKDAASGHSKAARKLVTKSRDRYALVRQVHGAKRQSARLLTAPDANKKLAKGEVPSYGLTLHHYVHRSLIQVPDMAAVMDDPDFLDIDIPIAEVIERHMRWVVWNLCPNAGDCTKVCVVENGHGGRPTVQRAWRARTDLFGHYPKDALRLLGYELEQAIRKHSDILFRPNVNSDVRWDLVTPALVDGSVFGGRMLSYGYTKMPFVLDTDGWVTPYYRVAYSLSERDETMMDVNLFLERGGSVAVVTDRRPGDPITQWSTRGWTVVDADATDEWIFQEKVIGDLSAKGRARKLIGTSDFVRMPYADGRVSVETRVAVKVGRESVEATS